MIPVNTRKYINTYHNAQYVPDNTYQNARKYIDTYHNAQYVPYNTYHN